MTYLLVWYSQIEFQTQSNITIRVKRVRGLDALNQKVPANSVGMSHWEGVSFPPFSRELVKAL